jgi:hypothetical protein
MPKPDAHDDLAALDFHSADESDSDDYSGAESDALDFSVTDDGGEESAVDALDEYAPAEPEDTEDTEAELDALDSQTEATEEKGEEGVGSFTVTNPPETVSVSAAMDGSIQRVELSPKTTSMTEAELAEEILVIADLARQKGQAGTFLEVETDSQEDRDNLRDFMENTMHWSTPEQADAAQAEVFATRYKV